MIHLPIAIEHSRSQTLNFVPAPKTQYRFKDRYKAWRVKLRDWLPYIKRKRHKKIVAELIARARLSADRLLDLPSKATEASIAPCIPLRTDHAAEICLFLTFAPQPALKNHVVEHVDALLAEGVSVVLIINTSYAREDFVFASEFVSRLGGCFIRENVGFDFAAWAHVYSLLNISPACRRLYLVNDSIVGPLHIDLFKKMISSLRSMQGDLLSLTENSRPASHLQSYFMVVNDRLLRSPTFVSVMRSVVNMPTKEAVIDHYEIQLTRFLRAAGFRCDALFPKFEYYGTSADDTIFNWARLIEAGFPFIKSKVLTMVRDEPEALRLVPDRYRE